MGKWRPVLIVSFGVLFLLAAVGGGLAALGHLHWGDSRWYFTSDPQYRLRCGQEALRRGEVDRVDQVALLLEADGCKDQAALLRGELNFRRGEPLANRERLREAAPYLLKALDEFNRIRDQGALRLEAAVYIGKCLVYLKQPYPAERALWFVLEERPNDIEAHRALAVLYYDQGLLMRAVQHLEEVTKLDPHDGRPYRLIGLIYKDVEQFRGAGEVYGKGVDRDLPAGNVEQNRAAVRKELAECLVKLKQYLEALEVLNATPLEPLPDDRPAVEALRAECLWALGRPA